MTERKESYKDKRNKIRKIITFQKKKKKPFAKYEKLMNKQRRMHKLKIINTFISFTNLYRNLDKYSKKKKK